jgi:hypothetical protein
MILRDLYENEKAKLARIKISDTRGSWQILMGMISFDLLDAKSLDKPVLYTQLIDSISHDYLTILDIQYRKGEKPSLPPIIFCWFGKMMKELKIEKSKVVRNNVLGIAYGLMDAVCGMSGGMTGKKQMDTWKFYKSINEKLKQETGHELSDLSEETYRYIVTCLEHIGFMRIPSTSNAIVDVSNITDNDIFDWS